MSTDSGTMTREDRFTAFFWVLLGVGICAWSYTFPFGDMSEPGPAYLPFACGSLIALLGVVLLVTGGRRLASEPAVEHPNAIFSDPSSTKNVALTLVGMSLCAALMSVLGFVVSVFLLIAFLMRKVGHISWKQTLLYATAYSLGTLIVFQVLLKTQLPAGWIWPRL